MFSGRKNDKNRFSLFFNQCLIYSLELWQQCVVNTFLKKVGSPFNRYVRHSFLLVRATVMNYFRIPLNLIVVVILLKVSKTIEIPITHRFFQDFPLKIIFTGCVTFLFIAGLCMSLLHKLETHSIAHLWRINSFSD